MSKIRIQDLRKKVADLETQMSRKILEMESFGSQLREINIVGPSSIDEVPQSFNRLLALLSELRDKSSASDLVAGKLIGAYREYVEELESLVPRS